MEEKSITIVGAGITGSFLAQKLINEGFEITVIDTNPVRSESLEVKPNILTVNCSLPERECLKFFQNREYVFLLTDNESLNVSASLLVRKVNPLAKIVVRIYSDTYEGIENLLDNLKTVNIVSNTAKAFLRLVKYPFAKNVWELGNLLLFKVEAENIPTLIGKGLKETKQYGVYFLVILLQRNGSFLIPKGDTVIKNGDTLFILVPKEEVESFAEKLQLKKGRVKRVTLFGYSKYTEAVLEVLGLEGLKVQMVENKKEIIEKLLNRFSDFLEIYEGYPTDEELLLSENLLGNDYILNLSEVDETNLTLSVFFKRLNPTTKVGVLLQDPHYEKLTDLLRVDSYISPKREIAGEIYAFLKGRKIARLTELADYIDLTEITYEGEEISIQDFKGCKLIVAVEREGQIFLPKGDFVLKKGDNLFCIDIS